MKLSNVLKFILSLSLLGAISISPSGHTSTTTTTIAPTVYIYQQLVRLEWDASPDPVTGYMVYYSENPDMIETVEFSVGKTLMTTILMPQRGKIYYYGLKAFYYNNWSGWSNIISAEIAPLTCDYDDSECGGCGLPPCDEEDSDDDSYCNIVDNCPDIFNPIQEDFDEDGIGNSCDPEPGCGGCGLPSC